jgi:hypothetical protein
MKTYILAAIAGVALFALTQVVQAQQKIQIIPIPHLCGALDEIYKAMKTHHGVNMAALTKVFVGMSTRNSDGKPLKVWIARGEDQTFVNYVETPEGNGCILYYGPASEFPEG